MNSSLLWLQITRDWKEIDQMEVRERKKALILGATSSIAQAVARELARMDYDFHLVARDRERLKAVGDDLRVRSTCRCSEQVVDLVETERHTEVLERAKESLGKLNLALVAYGSLGNQQKCETDFSLARREIAINFTSVVSILNLLTGFLEDQGSGSMAVITSVAGDRGRKSNYIYGSAKGAVSIYAQGLRNRLCRKGVHVLTIKAGFVDTPMTSRLAKNRLYAKPEVVAKDVVKAIRKKRDVLYTPWYWFWIMLGIRMVPERIFKYTAL